MIEIKAKEDDNQDSVCKNIVRCPVCKQVLADIRSLIGCGTIRLKCRRCGTYSNVDIVGT